MSSILRRLPPKEALGARTGSRYGLATVYRSADLVILGLGVMIGAGIFGIAGRQAATTAGPGVILSFMIAGIACMLAALCYAELSSALPSSGSAYTFTYVIFGEVWAWLVGWALILEMALAAAVVARAWSLYATQMLNDLGLPLPQDDLILDLFAGLVLGVLTITLALGARLGLRLLWVMVTAKLLAIGAVIVVGLKYFDPANLRELRVPAVPAERAADTVLGLILGQSHNFGWLGIFTASAAISFAYLGFDVMATTAEETSEAPRTVPKGMIRSLVLTTLLYIAVALVMVGMVPYKQISGNVPLVKAFRSVNEDVMVHVVNIGAVLGLSTVLLVLIVGQTRVLFSMARDGLLPRALGRISRFHTPSIATLVIGAVTVLLAALAPVLMLEQLVVIGTLFAFLFVAAGVIVMRRRLPDLPRAFSVPHNPGIPVLSLIATSWLLVNLQVRTWLNFILWMAFGLMVYFGYGRSHSLLAPAGKGRHRAGHHLDGPRPDGSTADRPSRRSG